MDRPNATQNINGGMVETRYPVVVRSGYSEPRCPSWKIHTIAPKVADSDRVFRISALIGNTMLPVNRNSTRNVAIAISAIAMGNVRPNEFRLSELIAV